MGCFESKPVDKHHAHGHARGAHADAQRVMVSERTGPPTATSSHPTTASRPSEKNAGSSYPDREAEIGHLKRIVDTTEENFIDLSSTPAPLEGVEAMERLQEYRGLDSCRLDGTDAIAALPSASAPTKDAPSAEVLRTASDSLSKCAHQTNKALSSGLRIEDRGQLVLSFQ
eukprot:CAMPEP_0174238186 /NCGR_PEP_ID=MMETSP0417-20130205/10433_1 /TAXON_ID=242541 /ORGANISM="Mayorella sp, Strain BSH-02190019" /LENGTH=170 /DNA_ID=CAMNT_0015317003 /DNA_START=61 /DNA_END=573 /DNA_ORIENTATION=+